MAWLNMDRPCASSPNFFDLEVLEKHPRPLYRPKIFLAFGGYGEDALRNQGAPKFFAATLYGSFKLA